MMEWLLEPFSYPFMQRALVGGLLVAVITGLVGTWVVLRGMTFLGDALVHGVVPGIALALLLGVSPLAGAAVAAVVMIGGINAIHRQTVYPEDTGIGLLFVGMLALGVIILSTGGAYAGDLTALLFGDALGVQPSDLVGLAAIAGVAVLASVVLYRPLLVLSFNEAKAELLGLKPRWAHLALLGLITLAVVGSFQTVGTLLVFGLLVAPPATAALVVRRVPAVMVTAMAIGGLSVVAGLLISFHAGTAAAATVAGFAVLAFFVVLAARSVGRRGAADQEDQAPA